MNQTDADLKTVNLMPQGRPIHTTQPETKTGQDLDLTVETVVVGGGRGESCYEFSTYVFNHARTGWRRLVTKRYTNCADFGEGSRRALEGHKAIQTIIEIGGFDSLKILSGAE